LDPENGPAAQRRNQFDAVAVQNLESDDRVCQHMGRLMQSFAPGLFSAADDAELPVDNLDLERAFRIPKSHERHIHGHAHAGVRIVQQGPTLLPALDAHHRRAEPFLPEHLLPYLNAAVPAVQQESARRRRVMRDARSPNARASLLARLEQKFRGEESAA
jgi:hypothetical protein